MDPPRWHSVRWFQQEFGAAPILYLAVPIIAGGEVCGVVRLINLKPTFRFEGYEERIVASAAARLGNFIYRVQLDQTSPTIWLQRLQSAPTGGGLRGLGEFFLDLLPSCIGPCEGSIRLCDRIALNSGEEEAIRRLASTRKVADGAPFRQKGDVGVSVLVWETGKELIVQDADDPARRALIGADRDLLVAQRCLDFPTVAGLPLRNLKGAMYGTIYVTRPSKHAFTDLELRRIQATVSLMGKELARREEDEYRDLLLNIYYDKMRPLLSLGIERLVPAGFFRCLCEDLLKLMGPYLEAEARTMLLRDPKKSYYYHPHSSIRVCTTSDIGRLTGKRGYHAVSVPSEFAPPPTLFDRDETCLVSERQRAVLTLGTRERPRAIFGLIASENEPMSVLRVQRLQEVLDDLWPKLSWLNDWGK